MPSGPGRKAVRKYLGRRMPSRNGDSRPRRAGVLSAYEGHLETRWNEGCRSALQLWKEIQALGFTGSSRQVSRWARAAAERASPLHAGGSTALTVWQEQDAQRRLPSTRRLAWILVLDPEALSPAEAATLACICQDAEVAWLLRIVSGLQADDPRKTLGRPERVARSVCRERHLQKIEELTLYAIEREKETRMLRREDQQLRAALAALREKMARQRRRAQAQ